MNLRPTALVPALGAAALLVLGTSGPAAAHGDTIHFTIGDNRTDGHVRAVAAWDNDNDPVDEPVAGTLTAQDPSGRTLGPWALVRVEGSKATYTTREVLPPGKWQVVVHCGFPDLGHGEATVSVPALAGPKPAASAPVQPSRPAAETAAKTAPAADEKKSDGTGVMPIVATAAAAALCVGGILFFLKRRRKS
ncbi:hypothetical protein FHS39_003792 [Streptomyces olivoverticillatus]|uniref:LPXTG cell wall anchor domain-containing protein n=1 Tax=Streptomyces olivoverticillatus TaxID=66427 RepID=A0A7W7LR55_9ACTN|nr:hypothetical protein [Streptomyces olivoverticillatus]MBB4894734.1 hypothetical protein [Streptomyces olivoverticillatus]